MINNRQGGRRRGRGGQRQGGGGHPGNRQDNRQRGNAAQLLEKYKSMARDSQLSGDRVQTEYYLQFADHYFRVLNENRSRFEDQRRQRGEDLDDEDGDDQELDALDADGGDDGEEFEERQSQHRQAQPDRNARAERGPRRDRPNRGEGRRDDAERANGAGDAMPFDALPPAIGAEAGIEASDEEAAGAPRPRRRTRTARPVASDDDIAPAA